MIDNDDDTAQAPAVAVISYHFWQNRFAGDLSVIGKTISVNGAPATVVGVTPQKFLGTLDVGLTPDVSLPLSLTPLLMPDRARDLDGPGKVWWLRVMGRLKPEVSLEQGRESLAGTFHETVLADDAASARPGDPPLKELPKLGARAGGQGLMEARQIGRAHV